VKKNAPYHKKFHIEVQNIYDFLDKNQVEIEIKKYKQGGCISEDE